MSDLQQFDLTGDLPTGTTLLEASAGTGKTFAVAALVTRYVAEGEATLDQLLVITFGRAASQELRERVREQLVQAERALADPASADRDHPVLATLLDADPAEVTLRHRRLRDALASFDSATIATTHQFCQTVLRSLGVAGDTDTGATLVESLDDLVEEVVDDVYLRRFGDLKSQPPFGRAAALALAATAVGDAHASLAPAGDPESDGGQRVAFAHEVRAEVDRRKRRPRDPVLRRSPGPSGRGPRERRRTGSRADAAAMEDRAGRRVPGHRPQAVGGARPGVHRPRHDGPDR